MWEFSGFRKFRRVKSFSGKSSIFPALLFRKNSDFLFHFVQDFTPVSLGCNVSTQKCTSLYEVYYFDYLNMYLAAGEGKFA